ncbi:hypothetical protein Bca4012_022348 [Brassica carinata]|uniref:Uncharacterized protein n=1 Tax=Brassica carinata TaxID=52824 RepID=A0A8X7TJG8_BRACI|nr:hypothetical protein Bca52824_094173 [Brassica carinata]
MTVNNSTRTVTTLDVFENQRNIDCAVKECHRCQWRQNNHKPRKNSETKAAALNSEEQEEKPCSETSTRGVTTSGLLRRHRRRQSNQTRSDHTNRD